MSEGEGKKRARLVENGRNDYEVLSFGREACPWLLRLNHREHSWSQGLCTDTLPVSTNGPKNIISQ